jgi:hypothetical protein
MTTRAAPGERALTSEARAAEEDWASAVESVLFSGVGGVERAMARLTMARIKLMSLYEARKMMGVAAISKFMRLCPDILRLSIERVRSASSRKRTLSVEFPICNNDIPSFCTLTARTFYIHS